LYIEGERVYHEPLSKRLLAIRDKIMIPYRNKYTETEQEPKPFLLLGKEYLRMVNVNKIFENIKHYDSDRDEESSGHRYLYQNGKRYNDNSGLLFVPEDREYKPWKCISIKKWIWPFYNTVDFLVKVSKSKGKPSFKLYILGSEKDPNNLIEYRNAFFSRECSTRLLSQLIDTNEAIIECAYDFQTVGEWIFYRIVREKKVPDSISTVLLKMENIVENITSVDIIRNFTPGKQNNHIERPRTTPHKPNYPNSVEREFSPNISRDIIYESPALNGQENNSTPSRQMNETNESNEKILKRKLDELNDNSQTTDSEPEKKKARIE